MSDFINPRAKTGEFIDRLSVSSLRVSSPSRIALDEGFYALQSLAQVHYRIAV